MKIGVAIPCYKYHIQKLKRCLDSIESQEVKPRGYSQFAFWILYLIQSVTYPGFLWL